MPAEIDTGGPTVLHCDYRAVCPIPILASATANESFSLRRENRAVRASIVRRPLPRTNESQLLDVRGLKSCCWSGFSSRRTGGAFSRSPSRGSRRTEPRFAIAVHAYEPAADRSDCQRQDAFAGLEQPESRLRDNIIGQFNENETLRRTRSRRDERTSSLPSSREADRRFLARIPHYSKTRENETIDGDCHGWRGWCSKRDLSTADHWSEERVADRVRIGKAEFSSQSSDSSRADHAYERLVASTCTLPPSLTDETWKEVDATNSWRCESRVTKVVGLKIVDRQQIDFSSRDDDVSASSSGSGGRVRTRKKRRECRDNSRFAYLQLALLLLLAAFGQCGLRKSSVFNGSARPTTIGLSVFAFGTVISGVSAAPVDLTGDAGVRAERSANLSHITGASRKIQMYIKNRHLQILPDGTVNGSNDDTSDYTIFQRTSVSRGQLRIQGVATCMYLCMDSCGSLYGSREYTDDCVFNETLEQHNYNTYSSAKWSTAKKTLYLGLNRRGQPRKVHARGHNLGKLSTYVRVLTQVAPLERVEALQRRMLGAQHNVRHRHNLHRGDLIQQSLCPALPAPEKDGRDKFRCRKRKKRKKRKRRCRPGEKPGLQCQIREENVNGTSVSSTRGEARPTNGTSPESKRSCEGAASDEACRKEALSVPAKKRKLRVQEEATMTVDEATALETATATATAASRNVTGNSNGKSMKATGSNAKKVHAAGSMSQSKKPNLTDGKKRKKKGPAARRNAAVPLPRKRYTSGNKDSNSNRSNSSSSTSAAPTATPVPIFATSSSSWWFPGASTVPSETDASPRRRSKPTSPRKNESTNGSSLGVVGPRRLGKAYARNRTRATNRGNAANANETHANPDRTYQSVTVKVPEIVSDRNSRPSTVDELSVTEAEDASRSLSAESVSVSEDASLMASNEHTTSVTTTDSSSSIEAVGGSSTLGSLDEENKSVEEVDNAGESDRFDATDIVRSTTTEIPYERLAM